MQSLSIENQLFPTITYLARTFKAKQLSFCPLEYYPKMGGRNRYSILTAQGSTLLTVPLQGGRDQRKPAGELLIDDQMPWQRRHWRTLVSAYNRSPFFEYYAPALERLYEQRPQRLWDFNMAGWHLVNQWLGTTWDLQTVEDAKRVNAVNEKTPNLKRSDGMPGYQQVFGHGFVPNLSILDALFNLGPNTRTYLESVHDWLGFNAS